MRKPGLVLLMLVLAVGSAVGAGVLRHGGLAQRLLLELVDVARQHRQESAQPCFIVLEFLLRRFLRHGVNVSESGRKQAPEGALPRRSDGTSGTRFGTWPWVRTALYG